MKQLVLIVFSIFVLVGCGGGGGSGPSQALNTAPVAVAGASQNVLAGASVTLDGSARSLSGFIASSPAYRLFHKLA